MKKNNNNNKENLINDDKHENLKNILIQNNLDKEINTSEKSLNYVSEVSIYSDDYNTEKLDKDELINIIDENQIKENEVKKNYKFTKLKKTTSAFQIKNNKYHLNDDFDISNGKFKDKHLEGLDNHKNILGEFINNNIDKNHSKSNLYENSENDLKNTEYVIPINLEKYLKEYSKDLEKEREIKFDKEILLKKKIIKVKKSSILYRSPANSTINQVESYYFLLFNEVEKNLDEKKRKEFQSFKLEVFKNLAEIPNKFPIVRGSIINKNNETLIKNIWDQEYLTFIKVYIPDFTLKKPNFILNKVLIFNKLYSPPIIASISGLLIGLSQLRGILFSKNHYISNIVEAIALISKVNVPLLYISGGVSFVANPGYNMNMIINKYHTFLSMIHRFIVMPAIGIVWVYVWTVYYGGIIKESKVIRISIFIPFCVPSAMNIIMIVNLMKFYIEETATLLLLQNLSMIITLTILYLIYFIIIGL